MACCFVPVNNNENQICSKWSVIKWENFQKENVMHIITTFGVRGETQPKTGPEGDGRFRAKKSDILIAYVHMYVYSLMPYQVCKKKYGIACSSKKWHFFTKTLNYFAP